MRPLIVLILAFAGFATGCSSADHGPRVYQRQATEQDTPFGGGFPTANRPDGDPFDAASRRNEVRLDWRGDNGAPETRVNTGGDTRLQNETGTQQTGTAVPPGRPY